MKLVKAHKKFLQANGSKFPYSDVRKTRQKFHVKWLMLYSNSREAAGCESHCFIVPSKAFKDSTVQRMILTKEALPLPPIMCHIARYMECWGRGVSTIWHHRVLDTLCFFMQEGMALSDEAVLHDCVEFRIRHMVVSRIDNFQGNLQLVHNILNQWNAYFSVLYKHHTQDFFQLARLSFQYVDGKITMANSNSNSNDTGTSSPTTVVSSATVVSM
jgi:hypothetical protein